ncbi:MAG: stage III sporulation protein AF [Lachnospiraceae bacterium]|nr:stage III sporulation protein AF [Lachnospiraceae bacterium]
MTGILEWVKNYSMVFLLLTVLTSAAAKKEYRKYIQLFVEIVLVITLVNPLLMAAGKSGDLFEKISYDSFWQGLEGIRMDQEKIDFLNDDYYVSYYEHAIEEDIRLLAEHSGYVVTEVEVLLNEAYGAKSIEIEVAKQKDDTIIVGTIESQPEDEELAALKEKIAAYYQIDPEQISIED